MQPSAELVWTQILQHTAGGFTAICSGVGAHADVAMVIALAEEIGASVGGSVARVGAIWARVMPGQSALDIPRRGAGDAVWEHHGYKGEAGDC